MSFSLISCKSQEINKNSYFLNYDFGGNYTISCNGIIIAESNDSSISHSYRILNPFISEKGKQNISLKIKHPNKELKINPKEIENFFLEIYMSDNGENAPFKKIKKLTLPPIPKPVDSIFYTWEFDADVNYKLENIFDKASDLTKEKPESLEIYMQLNVEYDLDIFHHFSMHTRATLIIYTKDVLENKTIVKRIEFTQYQQNTEIYKDQKLTADSPFITGGLVKLPPNKWGFDNFENLENDW